MVPGAKLVVLGKQGAGKGTQCVRLSHHYVVPHVSTGDMLRAAVKSGSTLGQKVKEVMDRGELLGDDLVMEMVADRLAERDARARGFILDGCPRTVHQAEILADMLVPGDIDLAVDLEVPTEQVLRRLAARRVCSDCGTNYSTSAPPRVNWTCDICGGEVVQRQDDTEEAIRRRLTLYEHETAPLIDWYERRGQLVRINGSGTADTVLQRIIKAIESRRGAPAPPSRRTRPSRRPAPFRFPPTLAISGASDADGEQMSGGGSTGGGPGQTRPDAAAGGPTSGGDRPTKSGGGAEPEP